MTTTERDDQLGGNEGSQSRSHPMTFSISKTRELCDAATEGPWELEGEDDLLSVAAYHGKAWMHFSPSVSSFGYDAVPEMRANAAFIAHARTALPQALDEIDRLTRERDGAVGLLRRFDTLDGDEPSLATVRAFLSRHKGE